MAILKWNKFFKVHTQNTEYMTQIQPESIPMLIYCGRQKFNGKMWSNKIFNILHIKIFYSFFNIADWLSNQSIIYLLHADSNDTVIYLEQKYWITNCSKCVYKN